MADILVKVNIPKVDCRNIYFVNNDNLFNVNEIEKAPTYISRDFKLVLRVTHVNRSGIRTQTKKSFNFSQKTTFLQALREVSSKREDILKNLQEGVHKELKVKIPTLQQAWDNFIEIKRNQISPDTIAYYTLFTDKWILS